jgi:hypothetical protein
MQWMTTNEQDMAAALRMVETPADETLVHPQHGPYLEKWLYDRSDDGSARHVHRFLRSDADDEMHDHPWASRSIILSGGYWEVTPLGRIWLGEGSTSIRQATDLHRVEIEPGIIPITMFEHGPRTNEWGFVGADGRKVPWLEHTSASGSTRVFKDTPET